ncbi:MAG TPA: hypothetical protein VN739_03875 [Nitrososphaerales archaeon]|nr:hypothetical protein [Nitrososphaerales archaeon]
MSGYKDLKDKIYIIAAVIYVVGMFPLYYLYQANPAGNYQIVSDLSYISIGGAFLVFLQLLIAAWKAPEPVKKESMA